MSDLVNQSLTIAIDYDNTFTACPALWSHVINHSKTLGHKFVMVTCRRATVENFDEINANLNHWHCQMPVICTDLASKTETCERRGIKVDIWIDDDPKTLVHGHCDRQWPSTRATGFCRRLTTYLTGGRSRHVPEAGFYNTKGASMNEQVKEAIQKAIGRVRSVDPSCFPVYPGGDKQAVEDLAVLAQAYLADHPADDDKLVTRDWLLSVGFLRDGEDPSEAVAKKIWDKFQSEDYGEEPAMQVLVETKDSSVWLEAYSKDGDTLALIELGIGKTRGDVRRLCRALGIELKGTT